MVQFRWGGRLSHESWFAAAGAVIFFASCSPAEFPPLEDTRPTGNAAWGYTSDVGPTMWASLTRDYDTCGSGTRQSPIDLTGAETRSLEPPTFDYGASGIELMNTGHTVEVAYDAGSWLGLDGIRYALEQVDFHAPSEHVIDGRSFPMEIHLVHRSASDSIAVVGLLMELGDSNAVLRPIFDNLPAGTELPRAVLDARVSIADLLPDAATWFRYDGSLTTPPCTETVAWAVLASPRQVDAAQIEQLRAVVHDNNRPLQPTNGRAIVTGVSD